MTDGDGQMVFEGMVRTTPGSLPHAPGDGPSTWAAAKMKDKAIRQRQYVWERCEERGDFGLTADELKEISGCDKHAIQPRLTEMAKPWIGWVRDTGQTRTNKNGNEATVYVVVPKMFWVWKSDNWTFPPVREQTKAELRAKIVRLEIKLGELLDEDGSK